MPQISSQKEDLLEVGRRQVCLREVGLAQRRLEQISTTQIDTHEIGLTQVGSTQVRADLRMLSSPLIPLRDSLLEHREVLLISHDVSLLFTHCCFHYRTLEEPFQGHRAWVFG